MVNVLIEDSTMTSIANAIRDKTGKTAKMKPSEMPNEISSITTQSGTIEPKLQSKSVTPSETAQTITPDRGYDGLYEVSVNAIPSEYIIPSGTLSVTTNGTHDVKNYESVNVDVSGDAPTLQTKTVTPTETAKTITPDTGYGGLSQVVVEAVSKTYVGSGVTKLEAKTYTPSTSQQTIASGQYLNGTQTISAVPTETKDITTNGTYKPSTGKFFSQVTVSVPTGGGDGLPDVIVAGDTPILGSWVGSQVTATQATDTGLSVTIPRDGTYRFYVTANKGSGYGVTKNPTIQIYKNGVAHGTTISVNSSMPEKPYSVDVECSAGDVIKVYATAANASYSTTAIVVQALIACIDK